MRIINVKNFSLLGLCIAIFFLSGCASPVAKNKGLS